MGKTEKKVDAYIAKSAPFAKPILKHFRELVHKAHPDMEEKIKWGFPFFDCKGPCVSIAAFKEHCAIGFWKASIMKDPNKLFTISRTDAEAMGHMGKITKLSDLPSDKTLTAYIREAVKLNEAGIKLPPKPKLTAEQKEIVVPPYFAAAIKKNNKASAEFEKFSYSKKKEYIEWLTEAKTEETRNKRMETAVEWISEGKIRNWKYLR
jgi:uncharacterized protein YdeI (YjbR/CyaY-like superfamily)